ncbi:Uncharacterized iron-regulated protein [Chitinophaga costaii]|uniref:Uncharacterized iron-regulated protein n=1 Tax=Chitinophaga costaii TaxID=1335309 RepID=A0A1C4G0K8_9BACT|nr:imelysin family protein [Chitinophaga costaii]PUZ19963.1 hypothetical protein DCM91_19925 [Chitinophaga costaii]SCC61676.1 Uncharacterized iron-regulated protein [Chitinophaga costaii]
MKKIAILAMAAGVVTLAACKKDSNNGGSQSGDFNTIKNTVITDFVNKTAIPGYAALKAKAILFDSAVVVLSKTPTDANLAAAQQSWRDLRTVWEQCEGYLLGPVEDLNYDPHMDTWPVDTSSLNALIKSNTPLDLNTVSSLEDDALHGFHPAEYILWGVDGSKKAADISAREMTYLTSLTQDVVNTCSNIYDSWIPSSGNYAQKVLDAGQGNQPFPTKLQFFQDLANVIGEICNEVGDGKMKDPYLAGTPLTVESPFSGNSLADFKNNVKGALDVYMGNFQGSSATSLHALVSNKNLALDQKVQDKFNAALNSFSSFTLPYEKAILSEKPVCAQSMAAILEARDVMQQDVVQFIQENIKD